jgi:hypothetical protein
MGSYSLASAVTRLVLFSCHETLEYLELKLWTNLGYHCFSLGAYTLPYGDAGRKRPGIPNMPSEPHWTELATRYSKEDIHEEMLEDFADVVIIMHEFSWVVRNWSKFQAWKAKDSSRRLILRTIGQNIASSEEVIKPYRDAGLEIVRYSPKEANIPGYVGGDAIIRFAADPNEYKDWNGKDNCVSAFTQSLQQRGVHCGWDVVKEIAPHFDFRLYGPGNESVPFSRGLVSHEEQKRILRDSGVFLSTGTLPASYTLSFLESLMTGTPIVALGPSLGHPARAGYFQETLETPDILDGGAGLYADTVGELIEHLKNVLEDKDLASALSTKGRQRAIELFGVDTISAQWKKFLG